MSAQRNITDFVKRSGTPATYVSIALYVAFYFFAWIFQGQYTHHLAFDTSSTVYLWQFLTYPLAFVGEGGTLFWFLIGLLWFYWVASENEHAVGTQKFAIFFLSMIALTALLMYVGSFATGRSIRLFGEYAVGSGADIPVGALTVAFATRNPKSIIRLWGIIPISGLLIGWLSVALIFFSHGTGALLLGVFAIVPLAVAHLYAAQKLPSFNIGKSSHKKAKSYKATELMSEEYYDDVKRREQEREERERLKKLFEDSLDEDKNG